MLLSVEPFAEGCFRDTHSSGGKGFAPFQKFCMFAQLTRLQYWKSEHTAQTCEDAYGAKLSEGMLVVADGVGTTLFSNLWARHLVDHFLAIPLLSDDPFEVEWWLRLAQEHYSQRLPAMEGMPWNVLQKVQSEGSFSTLAALCVTHSSEFVASAQLLALGDSCIFVKKANSERLSSFPLTMDSDFNQSPLCLPSKLNAFNRYFQRPKLTRVELVEGDVVVVASDAVARWLINAGNGTYASREAAFELLLEQTPASWERFVWQGRERSELNDDDCTALIMRLHSHSDFPDSEPLGYSYEHSEAIRAQRVQDFSQAVEMQNKELTALYYGDGQDLELEGVIFSTEQQQLVRQVADALREVLQVLRREINQPQAAAKLEPLWRRYAFLLAMEPCAASLRKTLERLGVNIAPPPRGTTAEMVALSPRLIAQRRQNELKFTFKSREQLTLEQQLRRALRTNEDSAIASAYEQVRLSPYAAEVFAALHNEERMQQALRREAARLRKQRAFASKSIERIAVASESLTRDDLLLSADELRIATLARRLLLAYRNDDAVALVAAADELQQLPIRDALVLTVFEEERLAQARQRLSSSRTAAVLAQAAAVHHNGNSQQQQKQQNVAIPPALTISEAWFWKICQMKKAYLFHWAFRKMPQALLEQETLEDLVNAPLIKRGMDEANANGASPPLLPEALLPEIFQAFSSDSFVNYAQLLRETGLTDNNVKTLLLIFLGRQLFEEYLLWDKNMQLQDWLLQQYGKDSAGFRTNLEVANPWVKKLSWWKG